LLHSTRTKSRQGGEPDAGGYLMLSHFWAMILFALFVSMALGCLTRRTKLERIKYAAWSFLLFLLIGIGAAWLMYPFSR
jgi:cytochrome bd-type quinol oxidase subunit 2